MPRSRALPLLMLVVALAGMAVFARGLRMVDTIGLLASGVVAGASLAAIASGRRSSP